MVTFVVFLSGDFHNRDPGPDLSTLDPNVRYVWFVWRLRTRAWFVDPYSSPLEKVVWSIVHMYLGMVRIRCESYHTKTWKWAAIYRGISQRRLSPLKSAYVQMERQHKQMWCSWWRKCTRVRNSITNVKAYRWGSGEGRQSYSGTVRSSRT